MLWQRNAVGWSQLSDKPICDRTRRLEQHLVSPEGRSIEPGYGSTIDYMLVLCVYVTLVKRGIGRIVDKTVFSWYY
jgi:hypothetical protein